MGGEGRFEGGIDGEFLGGVVKGLELLKLFKLLLFPSELLIFSKFLLSFE